MPGPSDDTLEELTGPVCMIAELEPTQWWPAELHALIAAARAVKNFYGFKVETMERDYEHG